MSKVARQLKSIAGSWPSDPFRPNMQLQKFFDALAEEALNSSSYFNALS